MSSIGAVLQRSHGGDPRTLAPHLATAIAFSVFFWGAAITLVRDWWIDPAAGHGLLLAPLAIYLAWQRGWSEQARTQAGLGLTLLVLGVLLRYVATLAAEPFTLRFSMLTVIGGLIVFHAGWRQLVHWWLPVLLVLLSIPLPAVVLNSVALPLQLQASQIGATMLEWRYVPVLLAGNVIHLPGHSLFVTEACSGLRSLTALTALGVLIGGLWLRYPLSRVLLVMLAVPIAVLLNGFRVFLIGFLVYYVSPKLGEGLLHYTEGWFIFAIAALLLGAFAWALSAFEHTRQTAS